MYVISLDRQGITLTLSVLHGPPTPRPSAVRKEQAVTAHFTLHYFLKEESIEKGTLSAGDVVTVHHHGEASLSSFGESGLAEVYKGSDGRNLYHPSILSSRDLDESEDEVVHFDVSYKDGIHYRRFHAKCSMASVAVRGAHDPNNHSIEQSI